MIILPSGFGNGQTISKVCKNHNTFKVVVAIRATPQNP
jgi:hypothetical protein